MPISTESLVAPVGRLERSMFPQDADEAAFEARLEAYVDEALDKTSSINDNTKAEEAQKAWAYYRAYDAIYERMTINPIEVDLDFGGKGSFTNKQIDNIGRVRDGFLNQFNDIISGASTVVTATAPAGTEAVTTEVRFW